jgi:hypothetical protein
VRSRYENGYKAITLKDCVAATSVKEHDNAIVYDYLMFFEPMTSEAFIELKQGCGPALISSAPSSVAIAPTSTAVLVRPESARAITTIPRANSATATTSATTQARRSTRVATMMVPAATLRIAIQPPTTVAIVSTEPMTWTWPSSAHWLGLGAGVSPNAPVSRRCCVWSASASAPVVGSRTLAVRRTAPPLRSTQLERLNPRIQRVHATLLALRAGQDTPVGQATAVG